MPLCLLVGGWCPSCVDLDLDFVLESKERDKGVEEERASRDSKNALYEEANGSDHAFISSALPDWDGLESKSG